jgi:hypothetical protein
MAGPDIAPLHSITSLPPYTPAGSVASAYTPSGGDANACMNDTGVPLSAATTGGANRMMSANAVGKAPTGTVASTFTGTAQGGASIPLRTTQPTIVTKFRYQTVRENHHEGRERRSNRLARLGSFELRLRNAPGASLSRTLRTTPARCSSGDREISCADRCSERPDLRRPRRGPKAKGK